MGFFAELVVKIAILIAALYVLRRLFYLLWVDERRRARDVELGFRFFLDEDTGRRVVSAAVPIYGDDPGFIATIGDNGLEVGYTPRGAVPIAVSQMFSDRYLLQVVLDGQMLPSREEVYDRGIRAYQAGIRQEHGFLIYSPEVLARGGLAEGITAATDTFLILPDCTEETIAALPALAGMFQTREAPQALAYARQKVGAEGELVSYHEAWYLFHPDTSLLCTFASRMLETGYQKLFEINRTRRPVNFVPKKMEELLGGVPAFDGKPIDCKLYFEESFLVTYWMQKKKYRVHADRIAAAPGIGEEATLLHRLRKYLLPEIVRDRAYTRKNLLRFALQYLLTTIYIPALALGIGWAARTLFPDISEMIALIPVFPAGVFSIMALIMSFVYGIKGVFAGKKLVRSGL